MKAEIAVKRERTYIKPGTMFWMRNWITGIGMTIGAAVAMQLMQMLSSGASALIIGTEILNADQMQSVIFMFPAYLLAIGCITVTIYGIIWFQSYFSLLVSMNVTRRRAVLNIELNIVLLILGLLALAALIWRCLTADLFQIGMFLISILSPALFISAAFCMAIGVTMVRWGKVGVFLLIALCALAGAVVGAAVSMFDNGIQTFIQLIEVRISDNITLWPLAASVVVYVVASIYGLLALKRVEVRR